MKNEKIRQKIRLCVNDYSQYRLYFVTICSHNNVNMFGKIVDNQIALSKVGILINKWWRRIEDKFPDTQLHDHIIMPDHLHGIIEINDCKKAMTANSTDIIKIIHWFKTMSTNALIRGVKEGIFLPFDKKLWQRSFHDRVIRTEQEYREIREYINTNPLRYKNGQ